MGNEMIGHCGIICSSCPAFEATRDGDLKKIEETAKLWSEQYGHSIKAADVWCDGCLVGGRKCGHCAECKIRACAQEKKVKNCGQCPDYACNLLTDFFKLVPEAQATLDKVRQAG